MKAERSLPSETLSIDKATTLFMGAISHAQSCTVLFQKIFEYIHASHPEYQLVSRFDTFNIQLAERTHPLIYENLPPEEYGDPWIESGLDFQTQIMWRELNKRPPLPVRTKDVIVSDLAAAMIYEDWNYLENRRHAKQPALALNYTIRESVTSYVCHFGLEGHSTGISEFDQMYKEVATYIEGLQNSLTKETQKIPPLWHENLQTLKRLHYAE